MIHGRPVNHKLLELNFCGSKIHGGRVHIGFILDSLKFQPVQIGFRNVSRAETIPADAKLVVPIAKIVASQLQPSLRLQGLHESAPQIEQQVAPQIGLV